MQFLNHAYVCILAQAGAKFRHFALQFVASSFVASNFSQWRDVLCAMLEGWVSGVRRVGVRHGHPPKKENAFRDFDKNHDGCLDRAELQAALEWLNRSIDASQRVKVTAGLAGAAFTQLDANGNDRVDESEFVEWVNTCYVGDNSGGIDP